MKCLLIISIAIFSLTCFASNENLTKIYVRFKESEQRSKYDQDKVRVIVGINYEIPKTFVDYHFFDQDQDTDATLEVTKDNNVQLVVRAGEAPEIIGKIVKNNYGIIGEMLLKKEITITSKEIGKTLRPYHNCSHGMWSNRGVDSITHSQFEIKEDGKPLAELNYNTSKNLFNFNSTIPAICGSED